jgi:hypothetical protein
MRMRNKNNMILSPSSPPAIWYRANAPMPMMTSGAFLCFPVTSGVGDGGGRLCLDKKEMSQKRRYSIGIV